MKRQHEHSQNFLRQPALVKDLFKRTKLNESSVVLDIGAGSGVISSVLARYVKKVIAIEFEPKAAEKLHENLAEFDNVAIKQGDFLTMPLPAEPYSVFANIPFHLSSPIIEKFLESKSQPDAIYLIVQKQFGRKLVSETDGKHFTSQLGMRLGANYKVRVVMPLQRTDFWPHPAVDTVFIECLKRHTPLVEPARQAAYWKFTQECFSNPKNLNGMPLKEAGMPTPLSPSRLTIYQWLRLFEKQKKY